MGRFAVHCKRQHVGYVVNVHRYSAQQYLCPDCFGKRQRPDFAIQLYVVQRQTDGVLGVVQPRYALVARHAAGKQQRGFTRGRLWSRGGRHIVRRQTTARQRRSRSRRHDVGQRRGFDGGGGGDRGGRGGRWLPSSASSALAVARAWGGGGGDVVDVHAPPPIALVLKRHGALTTGAGEFGRGLGGQRALHHFGVPARGGGHRVRRSTLGSGALCRGQGRSTRSTGGHLIFSGGPATKLDDWKREKSGCCIRPWVGESICETACVLVHGLTQVQYSGGLRRTRLTVAVKTFWALSCPAAY